jgi:hypothetical protein
MFEPTTFPLGETHPGVQISAVVAMGGMSEFGCRTAGNEMMASRCSRDELKKMQAALQTTVPAGATVDPSKMFYVDETLGVSAELASDILDTGGDGSLPISIRPNIHAIMAVAPAGTPPGPPHSGYLFICGVDAAVADTVLELTVAMTTALDDMRYTINIEVADSWTRDKKILCINVIRN